MMYKVSPMHARTHTASGANKHTDRDKDRKQERESEIETLRVLVSMRCAVRKICK